jgi:hypothetical protein
MHGLSDLDGDGLENDYYGVGDLDDKTSINLGGFPGGWGPGQLVASSTTGGWGGNLRSCDMDGDGKMDVLVCDLDTVSGAGGCNDGHNFVILRNRYINPNSTCLYDPDDGLPPNPWNLDVWDVECFDLDGNGIPDMLLATCDGLRMFLGQ